MCEVNQVICKLLFGQIWIVTADSCYNHTRSPWYYYYSACNDHRNALRSSHRLDEVQSLAIWRKRKHQNNLTEIIYLNYWLFKISLWHSLMWMVRLRDYDLKHINFIECLHELKFNHNIAKIPFHNHHLEWYTAD